MDLERAVHHRHRILSHLGSTCLMPIAACCVTDEFLECGAFAIAWHHLPLDERAQWSRVADFAAKLDARYRGLHIIRVRQCVGLDLDRGLTICARQADAAPALRPHDACKQCPGTRRWTELGCCLCTAERHLTLAGLQIWSIEIGIALPEVRRFTHVVAWKECLRILPNTPKADMVLEVLPDAGKVLNDRYSQPSQFGLVTNSGQHQHLWGVDRAQRYDDLHSGSDALNLSVMNDLHAAGSLAAHDESSDQRVTEHRQVRPVHVGEGIRTKYGLPHSVADAQVHDGSTAVTFHHQPVLALEGRNASRACGFDHGWVHRVRVGSGLNKNRSSRPAIFSVRRAVPIFNAAIDVQYRLVAPRGVLSRGREKIPVILVPARPGHEVDAGSTAKYLAHIQRNGASIKVWIRLAYKSPVAFAANIQGPLACFHDAWHIVATTALQQEDGDLRVLGQSAGHHRTGGARSADDEVIVRL